MGNFTHHLQAASQEKQTENESESQESFFNFKELYFVVEDQRELVSEEKIKEWVLIEPSLKMKSNKKSEIENIEFCPTDIILCKMFLSYNEMAFIRKEEKISMNSELIERFVLEIAKKIDKDPVDAKFKIEDSGIVNFTPEEKGIKIDPKKSTEIIIANIENNNNFESSKEISLFWETSQPEIKTSDVNNLGISSLIGEGKSNFRGSPKNRIFNINVATEKFNGILIKPNEEFSFIENLGPVDGEHGYAPELVIKKDKTEPEFGGGICQVSTTAFRAAVNSGLKITMRRNHAYPVSYYNPQGMDATVYIPRPDLRFINNTPGHILIQTKIEGTELTFRFYGTNDERKIEIIGPKITSRGNDGSMKTTFTQKVFDRNENIIIDDVFNSSYDSPSKYPHPGEEKLTKKPKEWSDNEWKKYKKTMGI